MGCICSFFKTLTSYHGSHLTPKQVHQQRKQRMRKQHWPSRDIQLPATPEKEPPIEKLPIRGKIPGEEDRLIPSSYRPKLGDLDRQASLSQHRSLSLGGPKS